MDKTRKREILVHALPAFILLTILVIASVKYTPVIMNIIRDKEGFKTYLHSFGSLGIIIFMAFQILHILIPIIPGEFVQIAGGYIYGTLVASFYLIIGTIVGQVLVFYIARIVGFPVVKLFVSKEKMERYAFVSNSGKIEVAMFVLFLIPGFPKDALVYIAGLTPIKSLKFLVISMIARSPGIIGSAFIGSSISNENYTAAIIMGVISVCLFVAGMLVRKKVIDYLEKMHSKS
jgi:uncharacterized membrane protein YdjX (TVP38/TMEM64 family)